MVSVLTVLYKVVMVALVMGVCPYFIGYALCEATRLADRRISTVWPFGILTMLATFELVSVPCIFLRTSFTTLAVLYGIALGIGVVISVIVTIVGYNKTNSSYDVVEITTPKTLFKKSNFNIYIIVALVIIVAQIALMFVLVHYDSDDAYYLGTATTSLVDNSLYRLEPDTGRVYGSIPLRYALSGFTLFYAFIAKITGMHVAVVAHVSLAIIFTVAVYAVWYAFVCVVTEDPKRRGVFLLITSLLYTFGNVSTLTRETFMIYRIWQGKAILANLILPFILAVCMRIVLKPMRKKAYYILFIACLAAVSVTEMGAALAPVAIMVSMIICAFRQKSIKPIGYGLLSCLPAIAIGAWYVIGGVQ